MARKASRTTPNLESQPLRGADFERAHSSVVLGEDVRDRRRGFTIVELLIVVVVIAILAAITIVAYNGITNRAKATAAATAAEQAAKKVLTYAAVNSDQYPATLSDAGVSDGSATYQYRVDNSANPRTFCVTATTQNVSSWVSSASATPASGVCAGHAATGQTLITNLVPNPSFESGINGWSATGGATLATATNWGQTGSQSIQLTASGVADCATAITLSGLKTNTTYTLTAYGRVVTAGSGATLSARSLRAVVFLNDGSAYTEYPGSQLVNSANASGRSVITFTTGSVLTQTIVRLYLGYASGSIQWDSVMLTEGSTAPSYADGETAGWAWNGAPNNSTSTGPTL